jgi:hypothetical protein
MRTCPKHILAYDETLGDCPHCRRDRALREDADDPQPDAPAAVDIAIEMPPPAERADDDGPPGGGATGSQLDEDTQVLRELQKIRENGVFTVVVIGFFVGGKTWFLNRMKHELEERRGYDVSPPYAPSGEPVAGTKGVEIHHVRQRKAGETRGFKIVDIPGERLDLLVHHNFASVKSVIAAMDMCGAVIVALPADEVILSAHVAQRVKQLGGADKLLLHLAQDREDLKQVAEDAARLSREWGGAERAKNAGAPVEEGLAAVQAKLDKERTSRRTASATAFTAREKARKRIAALEAQQAALLAEQAALAAIEQILRLELAHRFLVAFTRDLCFLSGLMSKLRHDGVPIDEHFDFAGIDPVAVNAHIDGDDYTPFDRPTFLALTKADLIRVPDSLTEALLEDAGAIDLTVTFDQDPLDTVQARRPSLANKIAQWFTYSKFDFVTAFDQHKDGNVISYDTPHYGIDAVFRWLFWAEKWDEQTLGQLAALGRARNIREWRDGGTGVDDLDIPIRSVGP